MFNYPFPKITHLDDVKDVLAKPEFLLVKKDSYQVVNYVYNDKDTFQTPLDAECRGLIFDMEGKLLSRRYHKFFNVGERSDIIPDLTQPHVVLEKLDGSMVSPLFIANKGEEQWFKETRNTAFAHVRWITKMGITDISMQVETWVQDKPNYLKFVNICEYGDFTPIFEWMSPSNKVVLDYGKEPKLVLTAVRGKVSGQYREDIMYKFAEEYKIPVVKALASNNGTTLETLVDTIRSQEGSEGVVIRFDTGHMVKIKSEWYVKLHKTKDAISNEAKVLALVLDEGIDDLIPLLCDEDKKKVLDYQDAFYKNLIKISDIYFETFQAMKALSVDRKTFAGLALRRYYPDLFFKMYDGKRADVAIISKIKKSMKKLDEVRDLIGTTYNKVDTDE